MIRRFCDRCGCELLNQNGNCVFVAFPKNFSVIDEIDETAELELCNYCEGELRRFLNGETDNAENHRS